MSEVNTKIKDALQELDFLNGEIGRVRGVKTLLEKDIEDLELEKAKLYKEFIVAREDNGNIITKLKKQIEDSNQNINLLKSEIGSLELVLEDKRNDVAISNNKLEQNEKDGVELSKLLEERRSIAQTAEEKAKIALKDLGDKQKSLNELEKTLYNQESSVVGTLSSLEKEREEVKKLKILLQSKLGDTDELKRTLVVKQNAVATSEKEYLEKLNKQKLDNDDFTALQKRAEAIESTLNAKLKDIKIIEDELSRQKSVLATREADLVLRERECRVREKSLSVKELEKQFND